MGQKSRGTRCTLVHGRPEHFLLGGTLITIVAAISLLFRLKPLMSDRDNFITLLARGDPASADRLSDPYAAYQKIMGKPQS
jgi:hypothetical protein